MFLLCYFAYQCICFKFFYLKENVCLNFLLASIAKGLLSAITVFEFLLSSFFSLSPSPLGPSFLSYLSSSSSSSSSTSHLDIELFDLFYPLPTSAIGFPPRLELQRQRNKRERKEIPSEYVGLGSEKRGQSVCVYRYVHILFLCT